MEPGKLNYARKGSMKDELSDTESKKVNVIGSLIDTNDENEKIIKSEEFSGEEEFADVKIGQDRTNAKKNENSHKNEGNSPTNANEIENYEDQKKLDPERDLMKNEDVFVKVGNNDPLSKEDLVGVPEQEDVLCKDDNFQEVEMVKTVREDEISQRGELLGDELCFSNEGVENAEVILGNVENEEITLGENGKQMIVNEFISEKEDNDREDIPKRFSENDGKKKICDNQGTEEVSQPGGDDNAGDDEGKGRDDNLTQRDDTIVTDDTIDRKEKELYEREKYSEAGERVDDGQNNLTETGEDRRIWESLPKREDEIVKDDSWNKFCERGSRSEIGEEVDDVRDTFTGENEERRMYDDHPKGEGLKIGDNSIRKIENEVCEQESSSQNEEVVDDARNAATEKGEDLRLCDSFLKDAGGDNFECSRKDLNEDERNFPDEKEVDRKGVNFIGSDQIKSDEIERDDVIEQTEEDMRMDKSTSTEKEMCGEQHVLSGIEDTSDELDQNEFRRSSGDGRIDRNLTDSNFMEEGSHYQEDGEDNFVKKYEPFESPSNVYEKGDETVTLEMDVYAGQNSFPENFVEIRMCENLSKRDGDNERIRSGIDDKNKERLSSRKSDFGENQEDYSEQMGRSWMLLENSLSNGKNGSAMENRCWNEEVDSECLLEEEENRGIDDEVQNDKETLYYNTSSENANEILKFCWVQYKNGRKDTEGKSVCRNNDEEGVKNEQFSSKFERIEEDVSLNDSRRMVDEIHDEGEMKTQGDLLPEEEKGVEIEKYTSVELEVSNDHLKAECSSHLQNDESATEFITTESVELNSDVVVEKDDETHPLHDKIDLCTTVMAFITLVGYVGDVVSDLVVCYFWFREGHPLWFGLSLFFTLFPTILINCISFNDLYLESKLYHTLFRIHQKPRLWMITIIFHCILLGQFFRFLKRFLFTTRFRSKMIELENIDYLKFGAKWMWENSSVSGMTMMEAFLESAPQLILQIYTMSLITDDTKNKSRVIAQVASMCFSLFMLSWSVMNYHRTRRIPSRRSNCGMVLIFLWHLCTVVSRLLSLALFATIFPITCLAICFCHVVAVSTWATYVKCKRYRKSLLFVLRMKNYGFVIYGFTLGIMLLFSYCEHDGKGPRRYRILVYYLIVGIENSVFITLWFVYVDNLHLWINTLVYVAVFVCFVLGIVSMIIYYRFFHFNILNHPERWKMKMLFPERFIVASDLDDVGYWLIIDRWY